MRIASSKAYIQCIRMQSEWVPEYMMIRYDRVSERRLVTQVVCSQAQYTVPGCSEILID